MHDEPINNGNQSTVNCEFNAQCSPLKKSAILVHNKSYQEVTNDNAIRLMLRCCKLYQALSSIKGILVLIIELENKFHGRPFQATLKKYDEDETMPMKSSDEKLISTQRLQLMKLGRKIASFKQDHPIFGMFQFKR